ncbi:MAG: PDZ domain-containing protein [Anaerolineae bacterium]|nr:PDZ domain-containing protein [Anaerolineae bacterium]
MRKTGLLLLLLLITTSLAMAQSTELPPAEIVNDEGGPVTITGEVNYSNAFFTLGVDEPLIILEDQGGFVTRNRRFIMSEESQTLGKITTDFFTSPFTYSIDLPAEPQASLHDVDNDGEEDTGVMVYAVAYWNNIWGDAYLEERDLGGGGWSGAYASTRIDPNPSAEGELLGGTYVVYAQDDQQGFPTSFGPDGKLFTGDEDSVLLPQGYTIVNLDTDPFTFSRERNPVIDLIEGEGAEIVDFSDQSYTESFESLIEMYRQRYAFTELKNIDWNAKRDEFMPLFEAAEEVSDPAAFARALRDFTWSIPDAHLNAPTDDQEFADATGGGLGLSLMELDDDSVIVTFVLEGGPAAEAGIEVGATIQSINGTPIDEAISATVPWSSPFSTEHNLRLQQLRYVIRFPVDTDVTVEYTNPESSESATAEMTTIAERESFSFSSFNRGLTGVELPVEYRLLDNFMLYIKIYSFSESSRLTIQLWERALAIAADNQLPGVIVDMRQNGGGWGFLADQMAAYFFDEPLVLGFSSSYDESRGEFFIDPESEDRFILPREELRYSGPVAVLVGPACSSACELFSYNMTQEDRAAIVGQYPTGGLSGGQEAFLMPEGIQLQFSVNRPLDEDGNIIIEGTGVVPTVQVPVTAETVLTEDDVVLDAAVAHLESVAGG